jgi:hypothetical protein
VEVFPAAQGTLPALQKSPPTTVTVELVISMVTLEPKNASPSAITAVPLGGEAAEMKFRPLMLDARLLGLEGLPLLIPIQVFVVPSKLNWQTVVAFAVVVTVQGFEMFEANATVNPPVAFSLKITVTWACAGGGVPTNENAVTVCVRTSLKLRQPFASTPAATTPDGLMVNNCWAKHGAHPSAAISAIARSLIFMVV